jgi:hypothetical protein
MRKDTGKCPDCGSENCTGCGPTKDDFDRVKESADILFPYDDEADEK